MRFEKVGGGGLRGDGDGFEICIKEQEFRSVIKNKKYMFFIFLTVIVQIFTLWTAFWNEGWLLVVGCLKKTGLGKELKLFWMLIIKRLSRENKKKSTFWMGKAFSVDLKLAHLALKCDSDC